MKTISKTYDVYTFDELSQAAKEKAINDYIEQGGLYDDWHEHIINDYTEQLESMGFTNVDIQYTGFWSQGDGASFTATIYPENLETFLKHHQLENKYSSLLNSGTVKIVRDKWHYVHENTTSAEWHGDESSVVENFLAYVSTWMRELNIEIYRALQSEYEYATNLETIGAIFSDMNATFLENGTYFE